jgi:hypothetical protein
VHAATYIVITSLSTYLQAAPHRLIWFLALSCGFLIQAVAIAAMLLLPARWALTVRGSLAGAVRTARSDGLAAFRAEPRIAKLAVVAMTLIGLGVRAFYLSCPMRGDESNSYFGYIRQSWWTAISAYPVPNNHVLNSVLAKVAITAFGPTPWALRLPAFIAGVALIPATYLFARAQFSVAAALVGTAFVTASSPLIVYSVNARGYSMVCLAFVLSVAIGAYAVRRSNAAAWCAFAVVSAAGFFAVPVMLYPFGATVLWLAVCSWLDETGPRRRDTILSIAAATIGTLILVADCYAPVAIGRGYGALTHNGDVLPQPWSVFWSGMPQFLVQYLREMTLGTPRLVAWIVGAAIVAALIGNHRLSRWRVPLLIPTLLWSALLIVAMHRVPYARIYQYVALVALVTAGAGIAGWPRVSVRWSSAGSLVLVVGLTIAFVRSPAMAYSLEFTDAPAIAVSLRPLLRPGDGIITPWWINNGLRYYLLRSGVDTVPLNTRPAAARRLIVITPRAGVTVLDSLLVANGVNPTSVDSPSPPMVFPESAVYLVETRSQSSR